MPVFHSGWELCRLHKNLRKVIRASYKTYLLWRVGVIVATKCHMNVFRILFQKRFMENLSLKETLLVFLGTNASGSQDVQAKRMVHVPVGEGVLKRCTLPLLFNETKTLSLSGSQPYYVSFVTWYQNKVLRRVDIKSQSTLLSDKARDRFQKERETIAYYS
jgi:hypothetical protein